MIFNREFKELDSYNQIINKLQEFGIKSIFDKHSIIKNFHLLIQKSSLEKLLDNLNYSDENELSNLFPDLEIIRITERTIALGSSTAEIRFTAEDDGSFIYLGYTIRGYHPRKIC
ncbi:MAG: hypothetical protein IJZ79_03215 [Bacilli bacterium]|nr:hypothetical protein [Bacilli bacterium]MBQ8218737.1 hypothetical protein [Bacilli bacterium]